MRCRDDRVSFLDVGPLLKALFPYSSEELAMLAASMELCTKVGPLPTFLLMELKLVQLQKEKKVNWFTNKHLQLAQHRLHDLHTKILYTEPPLDLKVLVFNVLKMKTLWGNDADHSCLSPLKWIESMKNYHAALVILSLATDSLVEPADPLSVLFAKEFWRYFIFFRDYPDFELLYPIWYNFKQSARNNILEGTLLSRAYYVQKVSILLQVREEVTQITGTSAAPSSSTKRPANLDLENAAKVPCMAGIGELWTIKPLGSA
ncbi:hypothetical protein BT96DRAFT_938131 [Gymnopus androsaceus JB14]|uniref:Uncharacterized protein n=1 Tax=Gymnopus androsaceus JB14 TaxID=1447944 RepID=A0A6A4HX41_9AGAR|nr:hypothetical protein BT96DRAFT_938131 [Gymnopus androsaceus JB14]